MKYPLVCCFIGLLLGCNISIAQIDVFKSRRVKVHQSEDSTAVPTVQPPEPQHESISAAWLGKHNQELYNIVDTLVVCLYGKEKAGPLLNKLAASQSSLDGTADRRTAAIKDFVNELVKDYNALSKTAPKKPRKK